jgi:hypothetical protein
MKTERKNQGFIMTAVLMLLLIGALVAGALVVTARQTLRTVERWQAHDECLLAAQTALERVKYNLYEGFNDYNQDAFSWTNIQWLVNHASDYSTNGTLSAILGTTNYLYSAASISAIVTPGNVGGTYEEQVILITNIVSATWNGTTRKIQETVFYKHNRSSVFDYAYFINNFGWFDGVNVVINGNIRANGAMSLGAASFVLNGMSYARLLNNVSSPFTTDSYAAYAARPWSDFFRPSYNVDTNPANPASIWEYGYNPALVGISNRAAYLDMPYIGNLNDYKYYAEVKDGSVSTGSTVLINEVFSGTGPSGVSNAADKGCIVLIGTAANPLVIDGPVVVDRDVIIKGYYTGQGTIYAGRNIHIIGDLIATNPPQWRHPDSVTNFNNTTLSNNLQKAFIGLCAKGSIILGDYRASGFLSGVGKYLHPPFTAAYAVSSTDADIGYVTSTANGTNYFNGNYTNTYGSKCGAIPTNNVARKYYESSLSDTNFGLYSPTSRVRRIDAVMYNNHLTAGLLTSAIINGGIICRDEALNPGAATFYMNWDSRIALDTEFKPYLPMTVSPAKTIRWLELIP